jgi:hypothetical protein
MASETRSPDPALILGVPIELGTGLFKLYQETKLDVEKVKKKETLFDHFKIVQLLLGREIAVFI